MRLIDGTSSFQPAIVAAAVGDTVNFKWPTAAQNPNNFQFSVARSNNSFPCQTLPDATPTWSSPAASDPATVFPVFIDSLNFTNRQQYAFRGFNSNNANTCPLLFDPTKSSQAVFAGAINVGDYNYDCASATTQSACLALVPATATLFGACVWCGFGNDFSNNGFCYTPLWSGVSSCPCPETKCFSYYGCPADARAVYCASACYKPNSTSAKCDGYVPASGDATRVAVAAALLLALLALAL